jgi:hypothetical protein
MVAVSMLSGGAMPEVNDFKKRRSIGEMAFTRPGCLGIV